MSSRTRTSARLLDDKGLERQDAWHMRVRASAISTERGTLPRNPLVNPRKGDAVAFLQAHPDDESLFTGGTIAWLAEVGVETVLITATLGELGLPPDPTVRASLGHDVPVGDIRKEELARACTALGLSHHEFLGGEARFSDSGIDPCTQRD